MILQRARMILTGCICVLAAVGCAEPPLTEGEDSDQKHEQQIEKVFPGSNALSSRNDSKADTPDPLALLPHVFDDRDIVARTTLHPTADSNVPLQNVELVTLTDGRRILRAFGRIGATGGPMSFDYKVQVKSGTYTTKLARRTASIASASRSGEDERFDTVQSAFSAPTHFASIKVTTKDPAFIPLTFTESRLSWNLRSGGIWDVYTRGQCWGAQPSALGTNWFIASCNIPPTGDFDSRPQGFCTAAVGQYQNWDFGLSYYFTWVIQGVSVCANASGPPTYGWQHVDLGEASEFLFGSVEMM